MRISALAAAFLLTIGIASAQRHKIDIDGNTPEGNLLQQIENESDDAKKLSLLEQFAAQYPTHAGAASVYEQLVAIYAKSNQTGKLLDTGGKLLALDPADVEDAHPCLKAALEVKRDPDLVLKWAVITSDAARKVAQSPKPADEDQVEDWTKRVDFAKQVDIYTEYAIYAMVLQTPDPKKKILLGEALQQRSPQSQYLPQVAQQLFNAYARTGDNAKALALAEKTIETDQSNAEMLLLVADSYSAKKQADKVADLTGKAIQLAASKPKPEGVSDADWATWRTQVAGRANYLMGLTYAALDKWAPADRALRAALPGIGSSADMKAEALFYLGLANYNLAEAGDLERARDALRFSDQCAAIPGPFQARARANSKAIRGRYHVQ
ncbi:MAG: tetratricopeptide repeat protein [Bryobacteraceae bacterium]